MCLVDSTRWVFCFWLFLSLRLETERWTDGDVRMTGIGRPQTRPTSTFPVQSNCNVFTSNLINGRLCAPISIAIHEQFTGMQRPGLNTLHNTAPAVQPPLAPAKSDSIQGRRASESRKDYLHRVLDRVTELGERKPPAKKEAMSNHGSHPPPPSYDEAMALGLFLDEKLGLTGGTNEEGTSYTTASSHSHGNNSRRTLRRSRPMNHASSHTQEEEMDHRTQHDHPSHRQPPARRRSARKGSLVERAHSLASEESVRAEMERIQREFAAEDDEDTSTKMSRSTNRSRDSIYKYPPALDATTQGTEEESESGGSVLVVTKRENIPSMRDAQSRPYVG